MRANPVAIANVRATFVSVFCGRRRVVCLKEETVTIK